MDATDRAGGEWSDIEHGLVLRGISKRLEDEFGDMFTQATLDHYVHDSYTQMSATWRVTKHIPAFVERFARQRLRSLAKVRGLVEGARPEVLFVCDRNDAASQIAAGLLRLRAHGRVTAQSAGASPAAELRDEAVAVMRELGVDLGGEFTRPLTTEIERAADVVVTLDTHDDVTIVDDTRYVAWKLPDATDVDGYRRLRDALDEHVQGLLAEIAPATVPARRAFDEELTAVEERVVEMAAAAREMLTGASLAIESGDRAAAEPVVAADDGVDAACLDIERTIVELIARQQPVAIDLRRLVALLQTSLHLERIADGAVEVARAVSLAPGSAAGPDVLAELVTMGNKVGEMLDLAVEALRRRSRALCLAVADAEAELDTVQEALLTRLTTGAPPAGGGASLLWTDRVSRQLARAGAHAVDIAEAAWFQVTGELRQFDHDDRPALPEAS